MKYCFKNANILSENKIIYGSVLVDGTKIVYVGNKPPHKFVPDVEIDVKNNLLMSGFVNAHCHTPSTVLRGISDDKPLDEWLATIIPQEAKLSDEDVYWSTMLGIAEYVRGGIVIAEEDFYHVKAISRAYKNSGVRARISIGYINVGKPLEMSLKEELKIVKDAGHKVMCNAHSIYGADEQAFAELNAFAKKYNLPVSTHMSETLKEVGDCSVKNNDLTPPELLEEYGFFDRKATVYHAVHCDKDDLDILANYDVNVVTCPASNLKLASGIAPLYAMQQKNINIAIGTDGAYSNNSYDMFKEMFLVATLNKAVLYKTDILSAIDVINMATKNGAKTLGYDHSGDIIVGNDADIILVSLQEPHQQPVNNIISNLVYTTKSSDVYFTMANGKILYDNGKYNIGEDIEVIYKENQKIKEKILEGKKDE